MRPGAIIIRQMLCTLPRGFHCARIPVSIGNHGSNSCRAWAAVLMVLLPAAGLSAEKVRNWQTGKVIDTERSSYFAGTVGSGNTTGTVQTNGSYGTYQGQTNTSQTAVYRVYATFSIESDTRVYVASERIRWRWSKPANITVNGPVKFAC